MNEILKKIYFNNTIENYLISFCFVLVGILLINIFKKIILSRVSIWTKKTATHLDNYIIKSLERYGIPIIYLTIIYIGINFLKLSTRAGNILSICSTLVITFFIIRFISATILVALQEFVRRKSKGENKVRQIGGLMLIINAIIWIIGIIFLFDNLGYDVTTVIAGLGIGGIAIALAAQSILGDLFNYFVIFLDRPFEIGDFIVIDDKMGVVDNIGIKTTRVKSLSGEELIFSNSDLTNSRIHNFKRMQRRRVVFKLRVNYATDAEVIKSIPDVLKSIILAQNQIEFDRAHFMNFGESSLDFEVVYFVLSGDYNQYMDIQQNINFRIIEEFNKLKVSFAFPTRTIFMLPEKEEEKERHHRFMYKN